MATITTMQLIGGIFGLSVMNVLYLWVATWWIKKIVTDGVQNGLKGIQDRCAMTHKYLDREMVEVKTDFKHHYHNGNNALVINNT